MSDSGYASLGPTLLARKGGAKPAMRPQLPVTGDAAEIAAVAEEQLEDLGWNDMGDEGDAASDAASDAARVDGGVDGSVVVPIDPETPFNAQAMATSPAHNPIVRRQQRRLEERLLADAVMTGPEDLAADETEEGWDDESWDEDYSANAAGYAPLHSDEPDFAATTQTAPEHVLAVRSKPKSKPAATGRRAAFTLRLDPERHLKLRLAATMRGVSAQALVTEALDAMLADFEELNTIAARLQRH